MLLQPFYLIALACIGVGDTLFLSYYHWIGVTPGCAIGGCEIVLNSPYSVPWGLFPLAYLGLLYYLGMVTVAVALSRAPHNKLIRQGTLVYTAVGLLFSIYFELFQYFVIHALCLYCGISAALTLFLFAVALWHYRSTR
jgi:uncharacterized membrane protein